MEKYRYLLIYDKVCFVVFDTLEDATEYAHKIDLEDYRIEEIKVMQDYQYLKSKW